MHEDAQSDTLHERAKNPPNHRQTYNNLQINSREIVSELENDQQNHFDDDKISEIGSLKGADTEHFRNSLKETEIF